SYLHDTDLCSIPTRRSSDLAAHAPVNPRLHLAAILLLLLATLLALAAPLQAAPRIGVATMQPGEIFFERFGHNAIIVDDPALPEDRKSTRLNSSHVKISYAV